MTAAAPSAPPIADAAEQTRAAGRRWTAADRWLVKHQKTCRRWRDGRFCWSCNDLEVLTNLTSRAYAVALDAARGAGIGAANVSRQPHEEAPARER